MLTSVHILKQDDVLMTNNFEKFKNGFQNPLKVKLDKGLKNF